SFEANIALQGKWPSGMGAQRMYGIKQGDMINALRSQYPNATPEEIQMMAQSNMSGLTNIQQKDERIAQEDTREKRRQGDSDERKRQNAIRNQHSAQMLKLQQDKLAQSANHFKELHARQVSNDEIARARVQVQQEAQQ